MMCPWRWSRQNEQLAEGRVVYYDSEFIREKSYFPKLALVQWLSADERQAVLHDPFQQSPPWSLLTEHQAPLVMHSGRQDLEIIRQESGQLPHSVRDTQIGFALCAPQLTISLADMAHRYLGIEIDKSETRSDWLHRPLDNKQLDYAANDVLTLKQIYPHLCAELQSLGRLSWWAEECRYLLEKTHQHCHHQAWYKLAHAPQLKGRETAVAKLLNDIRETIAQSFNLPRKKVLSDSAIIDIARNDIQCSDELAEYLAYDHIIFTRQVMLDEAFAQIAPPYPKVPRSPKLTLKQRQYYQRLVDIRDECAERLHIHPNMIATQKQLRYFSAGQKRDCRIEQGWRQPLFSAALDH